MSARKLAVHLIPNRFRTVDYFVTLTLKPQMYKYTVAKQLRLAESEIDQLIEVFSASGLLAFELTKSKNVHYHGIMNFYMSEVDSQRVKYRITDYFRNSKIIGFIDATQVENYDKSLNYCLKDYHKTYLESDQQPIRYNHREVNIDTDIKVNESDPNIAYEEYMRMQQFIPKDELKLILDKITTGASDGFDNTT